MNDLVSIIIPVYNAEGTLKKCIDSLLAQTYLDIEIMIINDGSTDSSYEIIDEYKKIKKIKIFNKKNEGVSVARNIGIKNSQGKYVTFSDSDDYWEEEGIESLVDSIKKTKSDLAVGSYYWVSKKKEKITFLDKEREKYSIEEYLKKLALGTISPFFGSQCNKLYKLEMIKDIVFREGENFAEDFLFNVEVLSRTSDISYVEKPVYNYVKTLGFSLNKFRYPPLEHWKKFKNIYYKFCDLYKEKSLELDCEIELSNFLFLGTDLVFGKLFTNDEESFEDKVKITKEILEDEIFSTIKIEYVTKNRYIPIKIAKKYLLYKWVSIYYFSKRKIRIWLNKVSI